MKIGAFLPEMLTEVIYRLLCRAVIDEATFDHQEKLIEEIENLLARLVDGHHYCLTLILTKLF